MYKKGLIIPEGAEVSTASEDHTPYLLVMLSVDP